MDLIKIQNFSFTYVNSNEKALKNIDLVIKKGEFVVICGPSGCGKTTLMSQLKREIRPVGKSSGKIFYNGKPLDNMSKSQSVKEIAMVFQDPENQIVLNTVLHELAFPLENMGYDTQVMRRKIGEISSFFGLNKILYKPVEELSGGEKQILNLASALLLQPSVLLLDEPTAQLDPIASKEFLQIVYRLNRELSMTIIISEHRLEDVFPLADKAVFMEKGKVKDVANPRALSLGIISNGNQHSMEYLPSVVRLYSCLKKDIEEREIPLNVREAKGSVLDLIDAKGKIHSNLETEPYNGKPIVKLKNIDFAYGKNLPNILEGLNLDIFPGEFLTILGENGTGKSTLLQIIAGLKKPQSGKAYFQSERIGYLAQNPMLYFIYETVEDELYTRGKMLESQIVNMEKNIEEYIRLFNLKPLLKRHPYDLSGGEKQKLALTIVLLSKPQVLLLDEPTKGLDPLFKTTLRTILNGLTKKGMTIIMVSHDTEFVASCSRSCALLFNGRITSKDITRNFFSDNYFYTTTINRVVREKLPKAITLQDVKGL